jgi:hypothetical protein
MRKYDRYKILPDKKPYIKSMICQNDLANFYNMQLDSKIMHPAQWFTSATKWYQIHTFNNPYNAGGPNSELALIIKNQKKIYSRAKYLPLIFWGIGKADTEMEIANMQLNNNGGEAFIVGIDINHRFLTDFANALVDKVKENARLEISFIGLHSLFENISFSDIESLYGRKKMQICLGNTIGNYDNMEEIIDIFKRTSRCGDLLLIGFQTDKYIETTLQRYSGNNYFEQLIKHALPKEYKKKDKIVWRYNKKDSQIEAWLGDIEVFRSKKISARRMSNIFENNEFHLLDEYQDQFTSCIQIYKYCGN